MILGLFGAPAFAQSQPVVAVEDSEDLIFTPPGFDKPGLPKWAEGEKTAELTFAVKTKRRAHIIIWSI